MHLRSDRPLARWLSPSSSSHPKPALLSHRNLNLKDRQRRQQWSVLRHPDNRMFLAAQQILGRWPWLKEERHRIFEVINFNEDCNYSSKLDPFIFVSLTKKPDTTKTFIFFLVQYQDRNSLFHHQY